jgi:hypothetical protein
MELSRLDPVSNGNNHPVFYFTGVERLGRGKITTTSSGITRFSHHVSPLIRPEVQLRYALLSRTCRQNIVILRIRFGNSNL